MPAGARKQVQAIGVSPVAQYRQSGQGKLLADFWVLLQQPRRLRAFDQSLRQRAQPFQALAKFSISLRIRFQRPVGLGGNGRAHLSDQKNLVLQQQLGAQRRQMRQDISSSAVIAELVAQILGQNLHVLSKIPFLAKQLAQPIVRVVASGIQRRPNGALQWRHNRFLLFSMDLFPLAKCDFQLTADKRTTSRYCCQ